MLCCFPFQSVRCAASNSIQPGYRLHEIVKGRKGLPTGCRGSNAANAAKELFGARGGGSEGVYDPKVSLQEKYLRYPENSGHLECS